jgi:hypothetical protein
MLELINKREKPIAFILKGENHYEVVTLPFSNRGIYKKLKELGLLADVTAEEFFQALYDDATS